MRAVRHAHLVLLDLNTLEAHLVIRTRYGARNYILFCIILLFLLLICFVTLVGETERER